MDYEITDGIADQADLEALKSLLLERGERLLDDPPKKRRRQTKDAYVDALSAWQEQRDMLELFIKRFANFVDHLK